MTSVGPPAGNPTTTRTGRLGYPSANDGATPANSNSAASIPCKIGIVALSPDAFWLAPSSARALPGTSAKRPPGLDARQDTGSSVRQMIPCAIPAALLGRALFPRPVWLELSLTRPALSPARLSRTRLRIDERYLPSRDGPGPRGCADHIRRRSISGAGPPRYRFST